MSKAIFTVDFSPNASEEEIDKIMNSLKQAFADEGYDVFLDFPNIHVDNIDAENCNRIMQNCMNKLKAIPLIDDKISDSWKLPKGFSNIF
jgi:hypothetical protein